MLAGIVEFATIGCLSRQSYGIVAAEHGFVSLVKTYREVRPANDPRQILPVLVTDLDEDEAAKLLLTLDPLAAMAEIDPAALEQLRDEVDTNDPALKAMIDDLGKPSPKARAATAEAPGPTSLPIPSVLQILVECQSELEEQTLFAQLQEQGYACRVLTL